MQISSKKIKLSLISHNEISEIFFSPEQTFSDLKKQIKNISGYDPSSYYIFFKNRNLTNYKNKISLSNLFSAYTNSINDNFIYIIPINVYNETSSRINLPFCDLHPNNHRYLFCTHCRKLICDECVSYDYFEEENENDLHKEAMTNDVVSVAISHQMKRETFKYNKTTIDSTIEEKVKGMKKEIEDLICKINKEDDDVMKELQRELKKYRKEEKENSDAMKKSALEYIEEFMSDVNDNVKMIEKMKYGSSEIKDDIALKTFVMMKENEDIVANHNKIEEIKKNIDNINLLSPAVLLQKNVINTFKQTLLKLIMIIKNKIIYLHNKNSNIDYYSDILDKLRSFSLSKQHNNTDSVSSSYNPTLNLSSSNITTLYTPIDNTNLLQAYDISTHTFTYLPISFPSTIKCFPKFSRSVTYQSNLVYISGGELNNVPLNTLIAVNTEARSSSVCQSMLKAHSGHSFVNIGGNLLVLSGAYGNKTCEMYNVQKGMWKAIARMNIDRVGPGVLVYDSNVIYIFFGKRWDYQREQWVFIDSVEKYDINKAFSDWQMIEYKNNNFIPRNILLRAFCAVCSCPNEKNYIIGGQIMNDGKVEGCREIIEVTACFNKSYIEFRKCINEDNKEENKEMRIEYGALYMNSFFYIDSSMAFNFDMKGNVTQFSFINNEFNIIDNTVSIPKEETTFQ